KSTVVRSLDVDGFSANLIQTLEVERYGKGRFVEWSWDQKSLPNPRWISRVDPQSPKRLDAKDCKAILEYFSRSVARLHEADKSKLKRLPFFLATHGGFVPLDSDHRVCVLPVGIPRKEIENLERHLKLVFTESWPVLSNLFKFLDLEYVSAVDVYCAYILPACLKATPFIPSINGTLQTASSFYDPGVNVFRIILPPTNFPLKPLNSPEWVTVLRTIGLIHQVSHDHFKK
ncbi:unnamed protein product, partial [Porites evermanni]